LCGCPAFFVGFPVTPSRFSRNPRTFRPDFNQEVTLDSLIASMFTTGFQATNVALAIDEINKMVCARTVFPA
jgi:deoxyhypusine synthase